MNEYYKVDAKGWVFFFSVEGEGEEGGGGRGCLLNKFHTKVEFP